MAKKSLVDRHLKRQAIIKQFFFKRRTLTIAIKQLTSKSDQIIYRQKLEQLPRDSSPVRLRNICWHTNRTSGFMRLCRLSRFSVRSFIHNGLLPGIRKSSW